MEDSSLNVLKSDAKASPGLLGYALSVALLVIGTGAFLSAVLPASREVREAVEHLQRVVLPEQHTLTFKQPGTVTLYHEQVSRVEDRIFSPTDTEAGSPYAGPNFYLQQTQGGVRIEPEAVNPTTGQDTTTILYRVGPYVGESLSSFAVPAAGTYELIADEVIEEPTVIAVGHVPVELLRSGLFGIYGGAVTLGLCFSAAVLIGLITWARRNPPVRR